MRKILKRSLSLLLTITIIFSSAYVGLSEIDFVGDFVVEAKAADYSDIYSDELVFLDDVTAKRFIGFIYNVTTDKVTDEMRSLDNIYNYLTGGLKRGSDEYINAQAAFLLTAESFVNRNLDEADRICTLSSGHLVDMLSEKAGTVEDVSDELANEILGEVKSSIKKILYYVGEFDESPIMNDIDLAISGYKNVIGAVNKARDFIDSLDMTVTTVFAMSSTNAKKAYTYYSTYVNNRQFGVDTVELLLDALLLNIDIFDGLVTIFESLGFENSWTNDEVQRLVRTFAEFTYHSKVEFEERYYEKPSPGSAVSVIEVYFSIRSIELAMNQKATIPARYRPLSATAGTSITYSSSNTSIMTVNSSGFVTPVSAGTANLIATSSNGCQAVCKITVYPYDVVNNGTGYTISNYVGLGGNIVIPYEINGISVTGIGVRTFYDNDFITSVTIPDGVTTIGEYAFYSCSNLTSVTIPDSVTSIENKAFNGCTSLTSIVIPKGVTKIAVSAFRDCSSLSLVTIPNTVITIEEYAFKNCKNIKTVTIPDSVKTIGDYAFEDCTNLKIVSCGKNLNSIGNSAFHGCTNLVSINIPDSVTFLGSSAFSGCKCITEINIPIGISELNDSVFNACQGLISVTIPGNVKSVGRRAFCLCKNLQSVKICEGVTKIGNSAFEDCESLETVKLPSTLIELGEEYSTRIRGVFSDCVSLKEITIPNNVKKIGYYAFYNCVSLTSITIPNSVTHIDDFAFFGCIGLTSVTIPESVKTIDAHAFCSENLNDVYITNIEAWCSITFWAFDSNPLYYADNLYINGELATDIVIPDEVISISDYAFSGYKNLSSIVIPETTTNLGGAAFSDCISLTSVTLPNSITNIKWSTFQNCVNLNSVTIPDTVTTIEGNAFEGCTSLISITIPNSVTSIGNQAFDNCDSLLILCNDGNSAHKYSIDNKIPFIANDENTSVDFEKGIICTNYLNADISDIMVLSQGLTYTVNSGVCGTGVLVDVIKDGVVHSQYTLVVEGDTNGDSICNVLDAFEVERASNGHTELSGAYAIAADSNSDDIIGITDYQAIVNKALAS